MDNESTHSCSDSTSTPAQSHKSTVLEESLHRSLQHTPRLATDPPAVLTKDEREICSRAYDEARAYGLNTRVKIRALLTGLGQPISDSELDVVLEKIEWHGEGHLLSFPALVQLLESQKEKYVYVEEGKDASAVEAFIALAGHKQGCVETDFLKQVVSAFELTFDIDRMLQIIDANENGVIEFEEFYKIFGTNKNNTDRLLPPDSSLSSLLGDYEHAITTNNTEDIINNLKSKFDTKNHVGMAGGGRVVAVTVGGGPHKRKAAQPRSLGERGSVRNSNKEAQEEQLESLKAVFDRIRDSNNKVRRHRTDRGLLTHEERISLFVQRLQVTPKALGVILSDKKGVRVLSSSRQLTHAKTFTPKRYVNAGILKKKAGVGEHQYRAIRDRRRTGEDNGVTTTGGTMEGTMEMGDDTATTSTRRLHNPLDHPTIAKPKTVIPFDKGRSVRVNRGARVPLGFSDGDHSSYTGRPHSASGKHSVVMTRPQSAATVTHDGSANHLTNRIALNRRRRPASAATYGSTTATDAFYGGLNPLFGSLKDKINTQPGGCQSGNLCTASISAARNASRFASGKRVVLPVASLDSTFAAATSHQPINRPSSAMTYSSKISSPTAAPSTFAQPSTYVTHQSVTPEPYKVRIPGTNTFQYVQPRPASAATMVSY